MHKYCMCWCISIQIVKNSSGISLMKHRGQQGQIVDGGGWEGFLKKRRREMKLKPHASVCLIRSCAGPRVWLSAGWWKCSTAPNLLMYVPLSLAGAHGRKMGPYQRLWIYGKYFCTDSFQLSLSLSRFPSVILSPTHPLTRFLSHFPLALPTNFIRDSAEDGNLGKVVGRSFSVSEGCL